MFLIILVIENFTFKNGNWRDLHHVFPKIISYYLLKFNYFWKIGEERDNKKKFN